MDIGQWLLLGVLILAGAWWLRKRDAAKIAKINGPGRYAYEVVGESHYAASFEAILGAGAGRRQEWFGDALLRLEEANPHDPNAVSVWIEGKQVGHLSREIAAEFREALQRQKVLKRTEYAVGARLWAGGKQRRFSVTVDLPMA